MAGAFWVTDGQRSFLYNVSCTCRSSLPLLSWLITSSPDFSCSLLFGLLLSSFPFRPSCVLPRTTSLKQWPNQDSTLFFKLLLFLHQFQTGICPGMWLHPTFPASTCRTALFRKSFFSSQLELLAVIPTNFSQRSQPLCLHCPCLEQCPQPLLQTPKSVEILGCLSHVAVATWDLFWFFPLLWNPSFCFQRTCGTDMLPCPMLCAFYYCY